MSLTPDESAKITAEERLRADVRAEIAREKNKPEKTGFFAFLNTQLGMWLLGTVCLGIFSFVWGFASNRFQAAQTTNARITKLYVEIAHRFADAGAGLEEIERTPDDVRPGMLKARASEVILAPLQLKKGTPGGAAAYDEFQGRSLRGMLLELATLGTPKDMQNATEIEAAIKSITLEVTQKEPSVRKVREQLDIVRKYSRRPNMFVFF